MIRMLINSIIRIYRHNATTCSFVVTFLSTYCSVAAVFYNYEIDSCSINKKEWKRMAKVRQDAWSHEDDLLLAETVLRHIREGSTQLNAFEEVGDALNRTSAACGFRWNAEVRNQYINAIDLAKRQRKERKRELAKRQSPVSASIPNVAPPSLEKENTLIMEEEEIEEIEVEAKTTTLTLHHVIQYLQSMQTDMLHQHQKVTNAEGLQQDNEQLQQHIATLERELSVTKKKLMTVEDDYHTFIQIMERARKMTVLEDHNAANSHAFKMDKNGNLEQLAQGNSN